MFYHSNKMKLIKMKNVFFSVFLYTGNLTRVWNLSLSGKIATCYKK